MSTASGPDTHTRIFLVPHPKIVFLYPTFLMAILAGLYTHFTKQKDGTGEHVISLIFLFILGFNLVVIAFDFPRTTSLTMLFAFLAIGIALWFFFTEFPDWWPWIHDIIARLRPAANCALLFPLRDHPGTALCRCGDQLPVRLLGSSSKRTFASPWSLEQSGTATRSESADR